MYDAIILKDEINGKKKNSADFENSYLAKNRFDGIESPWRDPYFKNHSLYEYDRNFAHRYSEGLDSTFNTSSNI